MADPVCAADAPALPACPCRSSPTRRCGLVPVWPETCPEAAAGELMAQPPELYSPAIDAQQLAELLAVSFEEIPSCRD